MAHFTKESLELLRQRVDLLEFLKGHVELQAAGASYKALCPFHEEKSPSFVVRRGDSHYHCFGCGAHGDALEFAMSYLKLSFPEAVESLAERFGVALEREEGKEGYKGPPRAKLKEALALAARTYHHLLLHSAEGHEALHYLYGRGIDLNFVRRFQLGLAPSQRNVVRNALKELGVSEMIMEQVGLLSRRDGRVREFFSERLQFPIKDASGSVIGFSGRKFRESTFGGKYINTPETPLFKKSRVLFGMSECRRRITKERRVIIVEGQLDALRLIHAGLNVTVAALGTAFGEGHAEELLRLGVHSVMVAFDGDLAGREAAVKVGDLFARRGVAVRVVRMVGGMDPDTFVQQEGTESFLALLKAAPDYLTFLVEHLSTTVDVGSPAGKAEMVRVVGERIQGWDDRVMIHESLKELAQLLQVPLETLGLSQPTRPHAFVQRSAVQAGGIEINAGRILEMDVLRWLVLLGSRDSCLIQIAELNLRDAHFADAACRELFVAYMQHRPRDLLELASHLAEAVQGTLTELLERRIDREKALRLFPEAVVKLLEREWMERRDRLIARMQASGTSEEEALALAKEFDQVKRKIPEVRCPI